MLQAREQWGSRLGFILAAAGSAIGLGNIWKFPYIVGENGGAAFIVIYLICTAVIGLPVLAGEVLLGRTTQRNPVGAFKALSASKFWAAVGAMGVIAGFLILSFYSVVAGWSFGYIFEALSGTFGQFQSPDESGELFGSLISSVTWTIGFHGIFIISSMFIVYAGVQKGIERGSKILMPLLLVLLVIMMIRGVTLDGAEAGLSFLFNPDWSKVSGETILIALGQAFFTLSLGMGAMLTYGSYMSKKDSVPFSSLNIVILDTAIAIIAGLAIFTTVFATGQSPDSGPGLIFQTLPIVFNRLPGGYFFALIFFVLLTIAAITSAISLLEVVTAYFVDERGWKRHKAVIMFGIITFFLGIPCALSFNLLASWKIFGLTWFDLIEYLTSNIMLPLGGLLISVFIAWVWGFDKAVANLREGSEKLFDKNPWMISAWKFFIKFLAPALIFIVLLYSLGLF